MGVDYSHLIKITGSPEPLQLIRGIKKNNSTPFLCLSLTNTDGKVQYNERGCRKLLSFQSRQF